MMMKEEHIVRRMLDLWSYQGKQKRVERCVRERERCDRGGSEKGQRNKQGSKE